MKTFEERLEALTQTLELTVRDQETHRRWIEDLRQQSQAHERRQADTEAALRTLINLTLEDRSAAQRFTESLRTWTESAESRLAELQVLARTAHERLDRAGH